jgi:hypothetical protein
MKGTRSRSGLERRHKAAASALSRQRQSTALDPYAGRNGAVRAAWPKLDFGERRAILEAIIDRVTVDAATRRGPRFDPNRVAITWRA